MEKQLVVDQELKVLAGGCHCGAVRFEVQASPEYVVSDCNCSICEKSGFLALIVPAHRFRLIRGADQLRTYRFNTNTAKHHFCRVCGIKSFYIPRSHPEGVSVNVRCLDEDIMPLARLARFDGQHWEEQLPEGRAEGFPNS